MFKKFNLKEDIASNTILKSSTQRSIRQKLIQQFPNLNQKIIISSSSTSITTTLATEDQNNSIKVQNQNHSNNLNNNNNNKKNENEKLNQLESNSIDNTIINTNTNTSNTSSTVDITILDLIWPKKEALNLLKCREHISILVCNKIPLFFQHFDGPYFPTLKLIHQYPNLLPQVQVDRGAIKFVISGANIMCPGLTSKGAKLPLNLINHTPVSVHAEGKELACSIGLTQKSSIDILKINKGIALDNLHWIGDDLWLLDEI